MHEKQRTHEAIDRQWVGTPVEIAEGVATVELTLTEGMRADVKGLVHGGFTFGLADYAAMLAVNDPNVVLGKGEMKFQLPTRVGDVLRARAAVKEQAGKKQVVEVTVTRSEQAVATGTFVCFVLDTHVLDQ